MEHVELSVEIAAPVERVWSAITDWPSQGQWMLGTKVTAVNGKAHEVGGQIEAFTGIGPLGFLDTMTITRWEPPLRCDVDHMGKVVMGTGTFIVEKISESTCRFVWSEDLKIPLGILGQVGFKVLKPLFLGGVLASLKKFARLVESGSL